MAGSALSQAGPDADELMEIVLRTCEEHWRETIIAEHARWRAQPLGRRRRLPAAGRTRIAFPSACGGHWRKVPLSDIGALSNGREAETSRAYEAGDEVLPVARCHLDGSVLVMEHVDPVEGGHGALGLPEWVGWVDCGQVGHDRRGRLVAYDI